jgi:hypothetical protein
MKASEIAEKFGDILNRQRTPIELALIVLILIHYAPTDILGPELNDRIKSMFGPVLNPIHSIMNNVFIRLFLWLILLYASIYSKDMMLFLLVSVYFVQASK